ncbi:hypothetical protein OG411_19145 [Streptomyces pseudogriseolus]|uniref:hypothetical protein n=1 Tax=Streptomyces pseudogriseolus TaxID=36817 RepID=UPI00324D7314
MNAASVPEWLAAGAIGAVALLPFAAAVALADRDLPRVDVAPAVAAVDRAAERARVQLAAWLLLLAWHLETRKGDR